MKIHRNFMAMNIFSKFLPFFFPPECLGCGREDFLICPQCLLKIPIQLEKKSFQLPYFEKVIVYTDYEYPLVERAIKKLKFHYARRIVKDLEPFFRKHFPRERIPRAVLFVPVPLHFLRHNDRGFNQSDLLAALFSEIQNGQGRIYHLLKRVRHTAHQSHLSKEERKRNVREAFQVQEKIAVNIPFSTPLVLVDDVVSTGSTLLECAKALKEYGYEQVWGMAIARG